MSRESAHPRVASSAKTWLRRAFIATCLVLVHCIPDDTTTPEGGIEVRFEPSTTVRKGSFTTDDGWEVTLERLLFIMDAASEQITQASYFDDEYYDCYGSPDDDKPFFDLRKGGDSIGVRGMGPGKCRVLWGFGSISPENDYTEVRYGPGVTKADFIALGTVQSSGALGGFEASNGSVYRAPGQYNNVRIIGLARKGERQKQIDLVLWAPPPHANQRFGSPIDVPSGSHSTAVYEFSPEQLLRISPEATSPIRFDAWADADDRGGPFGRPDEGTITWHDFVGYDASKSAVPYDWSKFGYSFIFPSDVDGGIVPSLDASKSGDGAISGDAGGFGDAANFSNDAGEAGTSFADGGHKKDASVSKYDAGVPPPPTTARLLSSVVTIQLMNSWQRVP